MGWLDSLFGTSRRFDKRQLELAAQAAGGASPAGATPAAGGQKGEGIVAPASEGKKVL